METQKELLESSKGRKKSKKKKSKFAETLEAKKPVFDPEDNTFEQYLDEYYGLDYEDIIGDLPCRFKYRKVAANDLGLSTEEILSAPDRELNAWASLKKTCQYRTEAEEQQDIQEFKRKGGNLNLKKKLLPSIFKQDPEEDLQVLIFLKVQNYLCNHFFQKEFDRPDSAKFALQPLKNILEIALLN